MTTEIQVWSTESRKARDRSSKPFSRQRMQATRISVQLRPKFKFGRPKFEKVDLARPNQDPTTGIKSERLDQMHLMLQRL